MKVRKYCFAGIVSVLGCLWFHCTWVTVHGGCKSAGCNDDCTLSMRWQNNGNASHPLVCFQYAKPICFTAGGGNCNSAATHGGTCQTQVKNMMYDTNSPGSMDCSNDVNTNTTASGCGGYLSSSTGNFNTACNKPG